MIRFANVLLPSRAAALPGAEDRDAALAQGVGDAGDERGLGADDDELDVVVEGVLATTASGSSGRCRRPGPPAAMPAFPGAAMIVVLPALATGAR